MKFIFVQRNNLTADKYSLYIWFLSFIILVFSFSASVFSVVSFYIALLFSIVLFVAVVFNRNTTKSLTLAVLFVVSFNASYQPIFGLFAGAVNEATIFYRYALGVRSTWYAVVLLLMVWFFYKYSKLFRLKLTSPFLCCIFSIVISTIVASSQLDARITYLVNSFIPLMMTLGCFAALFVMPPPIRRDMNVLSHIILLGSVLGVIYFFILPVTYDVFRPDLASSLRARPGETIAVGGYDPSWGTSISGYILNRFVGTFPDPIIAGYFFGSLAFAMFISRKNGLAIWLSLLLLLSLSKGAWLFYIQAFIIYFAGLKSIRFIFPLALCFLFLQLGFANTIDGSNKIHFLGLVGGILSVMQGGVIELLVGFGVGEGGNLARGYVEGGALGVGWLTSGSESGIGVLVHQLGFFGLFSFCFLVIRVLSLVQNDAMKIFEGKLHKSSIAVCALILSLLVNMPLQENCINASVLSCTLLGAILIRGFLGDKSD